MLNSKNIKLVGSKLIDVKKDYIRHDNIFLSKILIDIAKNKLMQ